MRWIKIQRIKSKLAHEDVRIIEISSKSFIVSCVFFDKVWSICHQGKISIQHHNAALCDIIFQPFNQIWVFDHHLGILKPIAKTLGKGRSFSSKFVSLVDMILHPFQLHKVFIVKDVGLLSPMTKEEMAPNRMRTNKSHGILFGQ